MGRGMKSTMPIIGLVVLALVFVIGVVIFGAAMQSVYAETNYTAENLTLIPYELQYSWWVGASILALIIGIAFAFYYFWG